MFISLGCLFIVLEIFFSFFYIASDGFGYTLSHRHWKQKYWKPINSFGFRDVEPSAKEILNKKVLFVVGDSFVAGNGIENASDRFADIIRQRIQKQYAVMVIAKNGWNTISELDAVIRIGVIPDTIVLSYYINDISPAASAHGLKLSLPPRNQLIFKATRYSSLVDFVYWRLYRIQKNYAIYWDYLKATYEDDATWKSHAKDMSSFIQFAKSRRIRLIVVAFPRVQDVEYSKPLTSKVCGFFQENGIECIDLSKTFSKYEGRKLIVSKVDPHPNEAANKIVADILTPIIINDTSLTVNENPGK
jgi:hypothetical protein